MPANLVLVENSRRHSTKAEKEARKKAEEELKRQRVRLTAPKMVKDDPEAHAYWKATLKRMKGIDLLDNVDTDMLGSYCLALALRDRIATDLKYTDPAVYGKTTQLLQAQERLILQYADKLGLTPNGRARLAKKRAQERPSDPDDDLFGG